MLPDTRALLSSAQHTPFLDPGAVVIQIPASSPSDPCSPWALSIGPSAPYPDFPPSGSCWPLLDPVCLHTPLSRGRRGKRVGAWPGLSQSGLRPQTTTATPTTPTTPPRPQARFLVPELSSLPAPPSPERGLRRATGCLYGELGNSMLGARGPGRQNCLLRGEGSGSDLGQGLVLGLLFGESWVDRRGWNWPD